MSPSRRFRVSFTLTRALFIELNARDAQAAEEIAQYVLDEIGQSNFCSTPEDVANVIVEDTWEVKS